MSETAILFTFVALILLPWFGGLFLTVVNFLYSRDTIRYQAERLRQAKDENEALRQERERLENEVQSLNLSLQHTLIENAMLSAKGDIKNDQGAAG